MGCSQNSWKTNGSEWVPSFQGTVVPSSSSCKQSCACTWKMKTIRSLKMWSTSNRMVHHISRKQKSILTVKHFSTKKSHVSVSRGAVNDQNLLLHVVESSPQHCMGHRLHHTQGQLKLSSLHVQFRLAGPSHSIKLTSYGCSLTASNNHNNTVSCHFWEIQSSKYFSPTS
jgi:hypothetical protein